MRAFLSVLLLVSAAFCGGLVAGGGVGMQLMTTSIDGSSDSEVGFTMTFEGMVPVYRSLYARASLMNLYAGSSTSFLLGTGSAFDLVYFMRRVQSIKPFVAGGVRIGAGSGTTSFGFDLGGGVEVLLREMPIRPYAEMQIALAIASASGYSITNFGFSLLFGARFGK